MRVAKVVANFNAKLRSSNWNLINGNELWASVDETRFLKPASWKRGCVSVPSAEHIQRRWGKCPLPGQT